MSQTLKAHLNSTRESQKQDRRIPQAPFDASTPSSQGGLAPNPASGGDFTWMSQDTERQESGYTEEAQSTRQLGNDSMDLTIDDAMNADLRIVENDSPSAQDGGNAWADLAQRSGSTCSGGKATSPLSIQLAQQEPSPRSKINIPPTTGPSPLPEFPIIAKSLSPGYSLEGWEDDAVDDSWSETFKTLGAVNQQREAANSNANEFGDVCGFFFKL